MNVLATTILAAVLSTTQPATQPTTQPATQAATQPATQPVVEAAAEPKTLVEQVQALWGQTIEIWFQGGWAMPAIAINALVLFGVGMKLLLGFRGKGSASVSDKTLRLWLAEPARRKGSLGELLDTVTGLWSVEDLRMTFDELRSTEAAPFARDLKVMKICVAAAPLLGLLGTVTGMLSTFGALASGSGGDKTMGLVAKGISEALITTETGLVIALPGLFFQYQMTRKLEKYKAFLAHVETLCTQELFRRQGMLDDAEDAQWEPETWREPDWTHDNDDQGPGKLVGVDEESGGGDEGDRQSE